MTQPPANAAHLLAAVEAFFPGFGAYWHSDDNLFRTNDPRSPSDAALFCALSHYVRSPEFLGPMAPIAPFFVFLEDCEALDPASTLSNAACTCFLENLIDEPFLDTHKRHLGPASAAFIAQFLAGAPS